MEPVIDAIIPQASATLIFLFFRDDQRAKIIESNPRISPLAWPHHKAPQKANKIGNGNAAVDPGILSWNRLTNAETIIAVARAIRHETGRSTIEVAAKTDNARVNRNKNPIKTKVGDRYLFIAKVSIVVAERQRAVSLMRLFFRCTVTARPYTNGVP